MRRDLRDGCQRKEMNCARWNCTILETNVCFHLDLSDLFHLKVWNSDDGSFRQMLDLNLIPTWALNHTKVVFLSGAIYLLAISTNLGKGPSHLETLAQILVLVLVQGTS